MQKSSDAEELRLSVLVYICVSGYRGQGSVGAGKSVGHMLISVDGLCNSQDHVLTRHEPPSYCLYLVMHSQVSHSSTYG